MVEKVHVTENGELIRDSDGKQIGELLFPFLCSAENSIYEVNGEAVMLKHGYMDENGEFHELCTAIGCSLECLNKKNPDCRYCLKGGEQSLYIDI
jgi:hypothetical protein